MYKHCILLILVIGLIFVRTISATARYAERTKSSVEVLALTNQSLEQHNKYRSQHGALGLVADKEVERYAIKRAEHMAEYDDFSHNAGSYGENLFAYFSSRSPNLNEKNFGEIATDAWYDEIQKYDFNKPGFTPTTGHFTQIVWKSTKKIGCAASKSLRSGKIYVVCNYSPPGNIVNAGQFKSNVLPKKSGQNK